MSARGPSLAERRQILVELSAAQRQALAGEIAIWRAPLERTAQVLAVLRLLRHYGSWLLLGISALGTLRRAKRGTLLERAWLVWRIARGIARIRQFRL